MEKEAKLASVSDMEAIEERADYFEILERYAERLLCGYRCLVEGCEKIIEPSFETILRLNTAGKRASQGNLRGAMTNHLKGHMRRGEV